MSARELLAEALDLCARGRKLDEGPEKGSATPWLWVQEQFERDLAEWEARAKAELNI